MLQYKCVRVVDGRGASLLPQDREICDIRQNETFCDLFNRITPVSEVSRFGECVKAVQLHFELNSEKSGVREIKLTRMKIQDAFHVVKACIGVEPRFITLVVDLDAKNSDRSCSQAKHGIDQGPGHGKVSSTSNMLS